MNNVTTYLEKHKTEIKKTSLAGSREHDNDTMHLSIVILSTSGNELVIGHLGRKFLMRQDDIIQIVDAPDNTPNLFGYGRPAQIVIKKTATLVYQQSVSVAEIGSGQPFALARPTMEPICSSELYSPNEVAWRQANRIPPVNLAPFATASTSYSQTSTLTNTQGRQDDSGFDDSQGDDVGVLDD